MRKQILSALMVKKKMSENELEKKKIFRENMYKQK